MSLTYLSGTPEMGKIFDKKRRKARQQKRKEEGGTFKKKVAKIGLAPSRAAFLAAVRLNVMKLATRLEELNRKNPGALVSFWTKFGGSPKELKEMISKGSGKALSLDPATTAAIAAALPIITVVLKTLKENKVSEVLDAGAEQATIDAMKNELGGDPEIEKGALDMPASKDVAIISKPQGGLLQRFLPKGAQAAPAPGSKAAETPPPAPDAGGGIGTGTVIALAAGAFLLPKLLKR